MDERNTPRGWRAEAEFRADQRVTAAIDVLRKMTAAGLRQHFADGEVMVRDMAPEQRARWDAQMDALNPIADAWIAEDCQVWWAIVLALLEERDAALAFRRTVSEVRHG